MILNLVNRIPTGDEKVNPTDWFHQQWPLLNELASRVGPAHWSVDLVLVDDESMVKLNEGFREAEGVTDVLSFSYLEEDGEGPCDLEVGQHLCARSLWLDSSGAPADEIPVVGEVILAPGFVAQRCQENSWATDLEFCMLVVHGLLHILGWDHMDQAEKKAMQSHEAEVLTQSNLTHPLRPRS